MESFSYIALYVRVCLGLTKEEDNRLQTLLFLNHEMLTKRFSWFSGCNLWINESNCVHLRNTLIAYNQAC